LKGDHTKSKSILLVDDEEDLLNMIREILLDEGYSNIMSAKSKREALEKFYEAKPDMLILDIMLPDGDGFSLLEEIRKSSNVPALFLSALPLTPAFWLRTCEGDIHASQRLSE
jgi:DNA-binding response OmpR family regulator